MICHGSRSTLGAEGACGVWRAERLTLPPEVAEEEEQLALAMTHVHVHVPCWDCECWGRHFARRRVCAVDLKAVRSASSSLALLERMATFSFNTNGASLPAEGGWTNGGGGTRSWTNQYYSTPCWRAVTRMRILRMDTNARRCNVQEL